MEKTLQNDWVFLPVHKTRIIKELDKATLIMVEFDRTLILPKVFKRAKETTDFIYYSLPQDFTANIRVSVRNEKTRRYEHKDYVLPIQKVADECGLDKPYRDAEVEVQKSVGESVEDHSEDLPFDN